jgi:virginiamycin B lyase
LKLINTISRVAAAGALAAGLGMVAWAAPSAASSTAGAVVPKPKLTQWRLPSDSNPGGVVTGPDGHLWATEEFGGTIDRVTMSGQITRFHLTGVKGYPNYITVGPDRALWFTVEPNNVNDTGEGIGRITTSGQFKFWPMPRISGSPADPQDIVAGPDDTLWFTFSTKSQEGGVGRVSLSDPSKVTVYSLGPKTLPLTIVPGPDRTFWFTEEGANRIGSITMAGAMKTYPVPGAPFGLTPSPTGGFWFTQYQGNRVGQITRDGKVTECPTFGAVNTHPSFILHKNGNFWLLQSGELDRKPPVEARLTAMDARCQHASWALPDGARADPWYLGSGPGDTLAFTQFMPEAVGKVTFEPGRALGR